MKKRHFLFLLPLLFWMACEDDNQMEEANPYQECCTGEVDYSFFGQNIFVPNAFSPNGDGINDLFRLQAGPVSDPEDVAFIKSFVIKDNDGKLILRLEDNIPSIQNFLGWDGADADMVITYGLYQYEIVLTDNDNRNKTLSGFICSMECGDEKLDIGDINPCIFPNQHNGEGQVNPHLLSMEECL